MKEIKIFLVGLVVLSLSACWPLAGKDGLFHDRENNYQQSQATDSLQIPPGLSDHAIQDEYVANPGPAWMPDQIVSILPPGSILNKNSNMAFNLVGNGPWLGLGSDGKPALLIKGDFKIVWKQIGDTLLALHYKVIGNDARIGEYAVVRNNQGYLFTVLQSPQGVVVSVQAYQSALIPITGMKYLLTELAGKLS